MTEKSPYLDDGMGFWDIGKRCPKCGSPLHLKSGQDWPMCWQCIVNKENARRGKALLERAKKTDVQRRIKDGENISSLFWGGSL